jgi:hypothetical protein
LAFETGWGGMMEYLVLLLVFGLIMLVFIFGIKHGWVSEESAGCCIPFDKQAAIEEEKAKAQLAKH